MTLLRLLTGPFGAPRCNGDVNEQNGSVLEERRRDEEDLIDTVLEIVFRVMWKGVEGFGESDWRVILVIETNLIARNKLDCTIVWAVIKFQFTRSPDLYNRIKLVTSWVI